jgi:hypothetical protein
MTDLERLAEVRRLVAEMSEEFQAQVFADVTNMPQQEGNLPMLIRHDDKVVFVHFGKTVSWFGLTKEHAIQFAFSLMTHAGARMERVDADDAKA